MTNYYLAPYVGTGTVDDPIRPAGSDGLAQWSGLDMRPLDEQTTANGYAIVATDEPVDHPDVVPLADTKDGTVTKDALAAVESALAVTLDAKAVTPAQLVEDLLVNHGTAPEDGSKWNTVQEKEGKVEVWLGGEKLVDKPADEAGTIEVIVP